MEWVSFAVVSSAGVLADVLGRKPMLLLAIALFLLGSVACGASQSREQLVLARALQGAGGGGLMTLTMLTVASLFPLEQRGRFQALLGAYVEGPGRTLFAPSPAEWAVIAADRHSRTVRACPQFAQCTYYAARRVLGQTDAAAFARGLQDAGYATDPMYADKLTRIIGGNTLRSALAMAG